MSPQGFRFALSALVLATALLAFWAADHYLTITFQWPVSLDFRWPVAISFRHYAEFAAQARADQGGKPLTRWQEYACEKFGPDCRIALAIQRAENPKGHCDIYHYNRNGTLDWGYFQVNTIHLQRDDLNLRDLLDCKANIDFAYQLFVEKGRNFQPWSTYNSGAYRRFLAGD